MTTDMTPAVAPDDALVYIRALDEHELRTLLPANAIADIEHPDDMFSVVTADGVRLAIVEGREEAFAAAIAHNLTPVSVH